MPPPPILDFSVFYKDDAEAKTKLVHDIKNCCLYNGFFQITGHNVPRNLQNKVFECSKQFFTMPLEEKNKISKTKNTWNRGYELMGSQILEAGTCPELKEGLYIGEEIPTDHPFFTQKKLNSGPNFWPSSVPNPETFRTVSMDYYHAVSDLAADVLKAIALTLGTDEGFFDGFVKDSVATMRYLHYPPQPADSDENLSRGIGAHTDFGAITLLLQDEVDGLQVLDAPTGEWFDVEPVPGAYVVNLGNLFMRWSNDVYKSNTHRVINKSGRERYSIPFFFSGNPDFFCECLPNCCREGETPKYPPTTVTEMVTSGYRESYGRAEMFKKDFEEKEREKKVEVSALVSQTA